MTTDISNESEEYSSIRVLDEYYQDIPEDLYIPPEAFAILLSQFEGPLDFLLYLVQKNGFDLKHLDISPIAQQYMQYMEEMKSLNIELTADYMVMAALLADIKSRLLLPKQESTLIVEDDPRKQLLDRLEQYLHIKNAAEKLGQFNILERDVFNAQISLGEQGIVYDAFSAQTLHDAMLSIFHRPEPYTHNIAHEPISLEERMRFISEQIDFGNTLTFSDLLDPSQGRLGIVVTFVAILELVKQQYVTIIHDGVNIPLMIQGTAYAKSSFS